MLQGIDLGSVSSTRTPPLPPLPRRIADHSECHAEVTGLREVLQRQATDLSNTKNELTSVRNNLANADNVAQAQLASMDDEKSRRERELQNTIQKQRSEIKKLNSIIIKAGSPDGGPSDDQVRLAFVGIRSIILNLTHKHYRAPSFKQSWSVRQPKTHIVERQWEFLQNSTVDGWEKANPEIRCYRVQAAVFDILDTSIFARPCFGLDQEKELANFESDVCLCPEGKRRHLVHYQLVSDT